MSENGSPYIKAKNHISKPKNVEHYLKYGDRYNEQNKARYSANREIQILRVKKNREEYRAKLDKLLGIKCFVCGREEKLIFHEIHGTPHTANRVYIILHYKDFVRLCRECHKAVHYLRRGNRSIDGEKLALLF